MINRIVKLARNAAIGFFVPVFVMGFFQKSVINLFVPKVQVISAIEEPVEKNLYAKGTVEAAEILKIMLPHPVIVDEYFVSPGDEIKAGDPIFRINPGYAFESSSSDIRNLELRLESDMLKV